MDLKTMLDERAEEMHLEPRIPASVLPRARRRRGITATLAGALTVGLALGAFVGARALLDQTGSGPTELRPGGTTEEFYPFIYPRTSEELEITQEQVADGSMPMWTDPEGAAILFAVNVMGWELADVQTRVRGDESTTVVIANPSLSPDVGSPSAVRTTLFVAPVPRTEPTMYAVLAAQAEGLELEPIGPEKEFGSGGTIGFRGSVPPFLVSVALTVDGGNPVFAPAPDGVFEIEAPAPEPVGPSTLISLALLDGSRNTIALTSSRIASPVGGETETSTSDPDLALPRPVMDMRNAIWDVVTTGSPALLRSLIADEGFTFTFGGETDPIRYWKRLESEGVPIFDQIFPALLESEPGFERGVFVWPAQALEDPADWDQRDVEALTTIHTDEDIRAFQEAGLYYGWRLGIDRDGTWIFFVAGD